MRVQVVIVLFVLLDLVYQTRENAELKRHIKRRTEALDRMRKAYIVDVENLKKKLRDQVRVKCCWLHHVPCASLILSH